MVVTNESRFSHAPADPRRILIFLPSWVGDVVMATAALRAIRTRFPNAHIAHLMRPYVADVLAGTALCDEQLFLPVKNKPSSSGPNGFFSLIQLLRAQRFDTAILLTNSFRSALIARLAGIKRRVGFARDARGWLLTDRLRPVKKGQTFVPVPALDYYNELARHVGCENVGDALVLATLPSDEQAIDHRLQSVREDQPLVVLNAGANFGPAKCWPAEKYAAVADVLTERYGARVVASLGPSEREIADRLRAAAKQPLEIFIDPPLGLGPLRALIRRCQLLITNDTGPRHFASALGVPVITVFGSSDPAWTDTRYDKERIVMLNLDCQPCMQRVCPLKHHNCMNLLEPALVLEKADEFLARWRAPSSRAKTELPVRQ